MLRTSVLVSFMWFLAVICFSNAEISETSDDIDETSEDVKTDFARHAMEISDLLRMFISLIKKADEEEGIELGLPEITTPISINLESASLEELFDRFETAAQSFRTRFLRYLKSTKDLSISPTTSTLVQFKKGEEASKYVSDHEKLGEIDSSSNFKIEIGNSASTIDPNRGDNALSNAKTTLSLILSDDEYPEYETVTEYSTSTAVPEESNSNSPEENTYAFILSNEDVSNSEMVTEYSSLIASENDKVPFSERNTVAFILPNEEKLGPTYSFPSVEKNLEKGITLAVVPITDENSETFLDFTTPVEHFVRNVRLDDEKNTILIEKSVFSPTSEEILNGEATLFESITQNEDNRNLFSLTDTTKKADITSKTSDSSLDEYTLMSLPTSKDFGKETMEIFSTKEDSDEDTMKIHLSTEDSDEDTTEFRSTTKDSDEDTTEFRSTTEDSDEDTTEIPSTTEDSHYTTEIPSTTEDSHYTTEIPSTTEDSHYTTEFLLTTEAFDENKTEFRSTTKEVSDKNSTFPNKNTSPIEAVTELAEIIRRALENYDVVSDKRLGLENKRSGDMLRDSVIFEDFSDIEDVKHLPKIPDLSSEYKKNLNSLDDPSIMSYLELVSEDEDNWDSFSKKIGLREQRSAFSHLDNVIGVPVENYPNYTNIPETSFTCEGKESPGLYADLETRCQVFHACWPLRKESYLCPVGTTFNQQILSCDYWFNSTCSLSPDYYDINIRLKDYPAEVDEGLYQYFDEKDIYPYNFRSDHSHPIFNEMKFLPFLYKIINYSMNRDGRKSGSEIDYDETVEIEFDKNATLPTFEDVGVAQPEADSVDSEKDRLRELLRTLVALEMSQTTELPDSSLHKMKLQERKYIYEKMFNSKHDKSGNLPNTKSEEITDAIVTATNSDENSEVLYKSIKSKSAKEQIAPAIVFKALETVENVVNKGILPITRNMLAANYVKLFKSKKL